MVSILKKKGPTPLFISFLQASGLVTYILLITSFFIYVTPRLSTLDESHFAPIIMLLLFVISAVISATIVLGKPAMLFWEKKYKEAFGLVAMTVGWALFYFLMFLAIILMQA